ncbi:MAG TPA: tetratricopeptide repeat protein [Bryobacteraceae bacterium]|jgi:tetratricopeptide (TPR) repeat protein|nr:tetratricopeptide repeat protein [Bryobacteraceae bacterium]
MFSRPITLLLAAGFSFAFAQTQPNAMLDGTKTPVPVPSQAPKVTLSPEMRGDIFMARKMYREAIDTFHEGPPKDPVLTNKIGIAYHQMMQLDSARKSYEQAVRLKPDYVEAINNLGTVYYAKKNNRRAISYYLRALKIAPEEAKSASIYMNLGTAYFARKRYEDATKSFQTALHLDPDVFERHGNFGVMLEERSVEERGKFHYYMAKLYAKGGRNELALQYLRKALEEGFREKKLGEEPEFASMKELPEFKQLLTLEPRVL